MRRLLSYFAITIFGALALQLVVPVRQAVAEPVPVVTASVPDPTPDPYSAPEYREAFFQAARVYGKAGCGDSHLAEITADNSVRTNVPADIIASVVAIESACQPLAISTTGDVGLMQINVRSQAEKYDNFRTINPFNPEENMERGSDILRDNIRQFGLRKGISRYNGMGPHADSYVSKVLALAGRKDVRA